MEVVDGCRRRHLSSPRPGVGRPARRRRSTLHARPTRGTPVIAIVPARFGGGASPVFRCRPYRLLRYSIGDVSADTRPVSIVHCVDARSMHCGTVLTAAGTTSIRRLPPVRIQNATAAPWLALQTAASNRRRRRRRASLVKIAVPTCLPIVLTSLGNIGTGLIARGVARRWTRHRHPPPRRPGHVFSTCLTPRTAPRPDGGNSCTGQVASWPPAVP